MTLHAGIASLAVQLPSRVVTNDELRAKYPAVVANIEQHVLGRLWNPDADSASARFDAASAAYLADPFRGCVERRWLAADEKAIDIEEPAARAAIERAGLAPTDIDALICCSFFPDQVDVGNAAFLARRLGVRCPAWNVESACSGSLVALQTACALVHGGVYARVLVVTSCTYSRLSPEDDTLAWGNGDGAAAFVVCREAAPAGLLACHAESTHVTCGAIWAAFEGSSMRMHTGPEAGRLLRDTAEPFLRGCVDGALHKAGMSIADVDAFVCNTPTAWYTAFCADVLGIAADKCVNAHPDVANIGPVLMPANLDLARRRGLLAPGSVVLLYAIGSVSNATATVMRCGPAIAS
ncbi:MAG TPA: 3-oxoacyl-[acyl-carrier-protein] synthase III C-terminal domain-containing protein [Vicinamibacterales bacterium]|nr:3-oxoacyl-[acyl-carrier-protein] synthase III C-terminal domain-containing protein [Vicinamibacterales bacterium]